MYKNVLIKYKVGLHWITHKIKSKINISLYNNMSSCLLYLTWFFLQKIISRLDKSHFFSISRERWYESLLLDYSGQHTSWFFEYEICFWVYVTCWFQKWHQFSPISSIFWNTLCMLYTTLHSGHLLKVRIF